MAHICYNSFVGFDSVSGFVKSPGLRGYQDRSEILVLPLVLCEITTGKYYVDRNLSPTETFLCFPLT